jgi:UPF0716 protein FxsA
MSVPEGGTMRILLPLLAWPLIEIALFVLVGGWIGVWGVLALVLATGLAGVLILQGVAARQRIALRAGLTRLRAAEVNAGVLGLLAGILLILPGFLTDTLGLLLLLPPVQSAILARIRSRVVPASPQRGWTDRVDEVDYVDLDRDGRPRGGSPWRDGDG